MLGNGFEKGMRLAILIALASVVVIAPLVGVYAFSPFMFVWGVQPYQLAVALSVMLAEAFGIAALIILVRRSRR
ncbi:MAG: hypothetical protein EON61_09825 [Alphaproteobacteria bacterium]|jgi:hypothetical protein|nr:MAG: hypothetical protein EON61_09825 [Alphaproteobacteria bacterium]